MADNQQTTWDIIKLNLSRIPWRDFVLGMFYVLLGIFSSYMLVLHADIDRLSGFLLGWPAVLVLLYFSVDYPQRYWTKHWDKMKIEIEAAQQYENREAAA